ncbi:hypothetical protein BGZ65_011716, partial [Modicella reniformis]
MHMLQSFWMNQMHEAENGSQGYKIHHLPLARIKKVMKTDEDVKAKMISAETPLIFDKGCEIFITEIHAEENKRRTLQRSDIAAAISKTDMFDFLIDIVPREDTNNKTANKEPKVTPPRGTATATSEQQQRRKEQETLFPVPAGPGPGLGPEPEPTFVGYEGYPYGVIAENDGSFAMGTGGEPLDPYQQQQQQQQLHLEYIRAAQMAQQQSHYHHHSTRSSIHDNSSSSQQQQQQQQPLAPPPPDG